jgi:hypothetical protein
MASIGLIRKLPRLPRCAIPAKAGILLSACGCVELWIPAFAGMVFSV